MKKQTLLWLLVAGGTLVLLSRACAHPARSDPPRSRIILPWLSQGAPRCNRWRGDDPWPCIEATLTAQARTSSTPTATFRPWSSPTPRPTLTPFEQSGGNREPMHRRYLPLAPTGGQPQSVEVRSGSIHLGYCAPMADGCYTAAHVLRGRSSFTFGRLKLPYSLDQAGRDLAHAAGHQAPYTVLRSPVAGELVEWSNLRAAGSWRVLEAAQNAVIVCSVDGAVIYGDSGTGGYAQSDGALIGILTNADLTPSRSNSPGCNGQQQARLEALP